jgi:CheY-like chemotaxis protein
MRGGRMHVRTPFFYQGEKGRHRIKLELEAQFAQNAVGGEVAARFAVVLERSGNTIRCVDDICTRLGSTRPDALMIVADYRLGSGIDAIAAVQPLLARPAPAIIVTGDTSPERIREVQASGYPLLHKPLDPGRLLEVFRASTREGVAAV